MTLSKSGKMCFDCGQKAALCTCGTPAKRAKGIAAWAKSAVVEVAEKKAPKAEKTSSAVTVEGTLSKILAHQDGRAWLTVATSEGDVLINALVPAAAVAFGSLGSNVKIKATLTGMRYTLA